MADLVLSGSTTPVRLGPELARGGEGAVHTVDGVPGSLIKLYLKAPDEAKRAKLLLMSAGTTDALAKVAAWPTEIVTDRRGQVLGFVMPRAQSATEAHELYTPKSRAQAFPQADFRFLLHVAANIVRAFGTVHQAGYVIGDVNHGQVLVGQDGRVTLIDCDSFQVETDGKVLTCDVGVPLFTPPELQGQAFRGLRRTAVHDRFGLAVMLFQLLFMGRHPYAGVPLDPGQSSEIEAAIKADRFAYSAGRKARGVEQPPGTLPLSTYGPAIADLFERAFGPQPVSSRPDETAWLEQLRNLQTSLRACSSSASHHYPSHLTSCPWCAIEAKTGGRFFGLRMAAGGAPRPLDLEALWGAVAAVAEPVPPEEPSVSTFAVSTPDRADVALRQSRSRRRVAAASGSLLAFLLCSIALQAVLAILVPGLLWFGVWPRSKAATRERALKAEAAAKSSLTEAQDRWRLAASGASFAQIKQRCWEARTGFDALPAERSRRLAALKSEGKQRELFLDGFRITREKIPGIGPGRIAKLTSFGIETAWDVTEGQVAHIPGFGPATVASLMAWRREKERSFRFNPNHPIARAEIDAIDTDLNTKAQRAEALLRSGPFLLRQATAEADRQLAELGVLIEERWIAWKQAELRRVAQDDTFLGLRPGALLILLLVALTILSAMLAPKTPQAPAPPDQAPATRQAVDPAPAKAEPLAPLSPSTAAPTALAEPQEDAANLQGSSDNQTSAVETPNPETTAASTPAPLPKAEETPALSKAISDALNAGATQTWESDGQRGSVSVGAERFYRGRPCRSFAYTAGGRTSAIQYACAGLDGVWRPDHSFDTQESTQVPPR